MPDTIAKSRDIGLDIEQWLEQDLVDILIVGGGYASFTLDIQEFVDLTRPYSVPVYPCINEGKNLLSFRVRALASKWYQAGADGIYTWNFGTPFEYLEGEELEDVRRLNYTCLDEIGDPETLRDKDKLYRTDGLVNRHYRFASGVPPLPYTLTPGASSSITLRIGDDVEAATQADLIAGLTLEVDLTGPWNWWDVIADRGGLLGRHGNMMLEPHLAPPETEDTLSITLNGQPLEAAERVVRDPWKTSFTMRYQLAAPPLKVGENIIGVSMSQAGVAVDETVTVEEMRLSVNYR